MHIESFFLKNIGENIYSTNIPLGSKLLTCKALPDGIHAWYETTSDCSAIVEEKFIFLKDRQEIPKGAIFVTVIDIVTGETEETSRIIILPIYKLS